MRQSKKKLFSSQLFAGSVEETSYGIPYSRKYGNQNSCPSVFRSLIQSTLLLDLIKFDFAVFFPVFSELSLNVAIFRCFLISRRQETDINQVTSLVEFMRVFRSLNYVHELSLLQTACFFSVWRMSLTDSHACEGKISVFSWWTRQGRATPPSVIFTWQIHFSTLISIHIPYSLYACFQEHSSIFVDAIEVDIRN